MNRRDNRKRPQRVSRSARLTRDRSEKTTVLIVCEGRETEPRYFDDLKRKSIVAQQFDIKVLEGRGGSRLQIIQHVVDQIRRIDTDYDEVWCVMDTERLNNEETLQDYRSALKIAADHGIKMALSNPAFEVWLLAHFVRTSRSFKDCDAVVVELNKRWKDQFHRDYEKSDRRIYTLLSDLMSDGLQNARSVRELDHPDKPDIANCNSSTEVYKLVGHLISS